MKKVLVASMAILALAGCKNNPYPDGEFSGDKTAHHDVQVTPAINVPSSITFSEGLEGSFTIDARMSGSHPLVTINDLPPGAVFTAADNKVTWKPDYNAGNDPLNPKSSHRDYKILIALSDATKPTVTLAQEEVTLIVNHTPRSYQLLRLETSARMSEGEDYQTSFSVEDLEAPNGPFLISLTDALPGTLVTQSPSDPKTFRITYTPPYDLVKWDSSSSRQPFNWSLTVIDSKQRALNVPISWEISDERQSAQFVGPKEITVTTHDFDFLFLAKDPNFEIEPVVTISQVTNGTATIDPLPLGKPKMKAKANARVTEMPAQAYRIHWVNIPQTANGLSEDLEVKMCVHNHWNQRIDNCTTQDVSVKFNFPTPSPTPTGSPSPIGGRQ